MSNSPLQPPTEHAVMNTGTVKTTVKVQVVALVTLIAVRLAASEVALFYAAVVLLGIFYLRHAWHLWHLDHEYFPSFFGAWQSVLAVIRKRSTGTPLHFWTDVFPEVVLGPVLTAVVLWLWLWFAWVCGAVDRVTEEPAQYPGPFSTAFTIALVFYYGWTVSKRLERLRKRGVDASGAT